MEELRDRIVKTALAIGAAFIIGFILANPLLRLIANQSGVGDSGWDIRSPIEVLTVYMKVAFYIALGIAMPVIIYQFFGFLAPGLTNKEKRILLASLPFVAFLFVFGAAYAFFQAIPRSLALLKSFGEMAGFSWQIDGDETIGFYLTLMVGLGLAFQLPVVMFLLAKLNIVSPQKMRMYRKYAILVIMVVSAVITPTTDPISLALVAVPLYLLYEIGILISYLFARRKPPTPPVAAKPA
jgi:sec-independent protein translocase protein TatC